ncbi:MAG: ferrous iron transporter B [Clostridia bacterium]|nr:ferrous iron transporter B [Clostridia bacterium]
MGLTKSSTGTGAYDSFSIVSNKDNGYIIALAGNPNVGKSTVFNQLTGMHQHTGNWPGKTVTGAVGEYKYNDKNITLVDLPGTYSLLANSAEEEVARDFLCSDEKDAVVVVCDAVCLERNLNLVLQILEITDKTVVCINLIDEARKKKIKIDREKLQKLLGVRVVFTEARSKKGLDELSRAIIETAEEKGEKSVVSEKKSATETVKLAEEIARQVIKFENEEYDERDRKLDKLLTGKLGFLVMFLMLLGIFWLTITGSNYPSSVLSSFLFKTEEWLYSGLIYINCPVFICEMLVRGVYRMLIWVVSVMLPPMAIFFPLFTLLEDLGYLPRVAFNLDKCFKKCSACGKQALTMCMGFGCNAAGVVGCRIIDSKRERLIAILTNNFVPCNGRFPTLISIISMFIITERAGIFKSSLAVVVLISIILVGILITLLVSRLLSLTVLKGVPSSFTLELPPYRVPQFGKVLVRSIFDRTLFVLGRAAAVAAPAGLIIWLMANVTVGENTLLFTVGNALDPVGRALGLDGIILMAFILGFPANETVIPIMLMAYLSGGALTEITDLEQLKMILSQNGWTNLTAINVMLFSLMHWPCSTTLMTIKKETGSLKWTFASAIIPTVIGVLMCILTTSVSRII